MTQIEVALSTAIDPDKLDLSELGNGTHSLVKDAGGQYLIETDNPSFINYVLDGRLPGVTRRVTQ